MPANSRRIGRRSRVLSVENLLVRNLGSVIVFESNPVRRRTCVDINRRNVDCRRDSRVRSAPPEEAGTLARRFFGRRSILSVRNHFRLKEILVPIKEPDDKYVRIVLSHQRHVRLDVFIRVAPSNETVPDALRVGGRRGVVADINRLRIAKGSPVPILESNGKLLAVGYGCRSGWFSCSREPRYGPRRKDSPGLVILGVDGATARA